MLNTTITLDDITYMRTELSDEPRIREILNTFNYLNSDAPHRNIIPVTSGFSLKIGKLNVIYGPSGSGKSTVLSNIKKLLGGEELIESPERDDFLINIVGRDIGEAIQILTHAGLGEGNLFLRKFSQLSEGQKFRMRIALQLNNMSKNMNSHRSVYIDEFGSNLDPSTAKAIARTFSNAIKHSNSIVFVCCNDLEVAKSFNYDSLICLGYDHVSTVEYSQSNKGFQTINSLNIKVEKGDIGHYRDFKRYHYLDLESRINEADLFVAKVEDKIVGVTLLVQPIPREIVNLDSYFELINSKMVTGYRTVVHPEFRAMGVGRALAINAPKLAGYEIVETRSALYHFIPIPEHWGYTNANKYFDEVYWSNRPANIILEQYILDNGFDPALMFDEKYCIEFVEKADRQELSEFIWADKVEQTQNVLSYLVKVMSDCGYPYDGVFDTLLDKVIAKESAPITDTDFIVKLKGHKQARYSAFYMKL